MLEYENLPAHKYAYDRPSPKLLGFLRKHFNLTKYSPQANNFVIFDQYFSSSRPQKQSSYAYNEEENKYRVGAGGKDLQDDVRSSQQSQ